MNLQLGTKLVMTSVAGKSNVYVSKVQTYSTLPDDYWFKYDDDETVRPIVHPDTSLLIHGDFVLPIGLVTQVMKLRN